MATLAQWLNDLATRIGGEIKAVRASLSNYVTTSAHTTALSGKADLSSPALTGVPTAPTAAAGTNTTQIATTAFATTGLNLKANLASPTFTGTPAAPTASQGTNTTQLATTAFVTTGLNLKASLAGATFTGLIAAPNHLTTMSAFCSGKPAASEVVGGQIFPVATTITAGSCRAVATVAATASTVFTIRKDTTTVGTITFAAGATLGTVSITSGAITALQHVTIEAPATADATLANISFLVRA